MADGAIFGIEKLVRENGEKLSEDDKKTLTDAVEKFKKDIADDNDAESIKKKMGEFSQSTQAIVMKLYQSANPNGAAQEGAASTESNDDVHIS